MEKILILDFGSQYTQLIARRVREFGVFSEIKPCTTKCSPDVLQGAKGLVLSGGPASVDDPDAPPFDRSWLDAGVPMLGVCYGMQLLAHLLGGKVSRSETREYGPALLKVSSVSGLFEGFAPEELTTVWMSHADHVTSLPPGFTATASTDRVEHSAMSDPKRGIHAVQFHPEVVHSARGAEMIRNFVINIAGCEATWTPDNFIDASVSHIRSTLQDPNARVICGLSGGVDSTVAATLVHRAVGDRLTCIFVDNGLLRKHEAADVVKMLGTEGLGLPLLPVDAGKRFLAELDGVTDPEQKRKIIGRVFVEVFDEEAKKLGAVTHLVQGTLYPDVIESVSVRGPSATIKTHHNVGGLPEKMKLKLIEPLRELFKDEVRALGAVLDIPKPLLQRQPFPGPGLAVRILGAVTPESVAMLQEADRIFLDEIRAEDYYTRLWQSFAVLLPVKSVGVMGDGRTYQRTIALRAVQSEDGMTADWAYLPETLLRRVSNRITNEVPGVNRVVLDISSKPPSTIEWE